MNNIFYCWLSSQMDSSDPPGPAISMSGVIVAPNGDPVLPEANLWALIPITYGMTQADLTTAIVDALADGFSYTDPLDIVYLPQLPAGV